MLKFERKQRGNARQWCKYCSVFVANNERCINDHNNCATHKMNVQKYENTRKREVLEQQRTEREIDIEMEKIRARAGEIEKGIQTQRKSELDEEFEMARQLYGDELLKELTEPKEKTNKVATYNAIMKSLPTRIPKKHKTPIRGFNLQ